jgi:hypothetical protein
MHGGELTKAYKILVGGNEGGEHGKHWLKYEASIIEVGFTKSD